MALTKDVADTNTIHDPSSDLPDTLSLRPLLTLKRKITQDATMPTLQRQTADALVSAFNSMSISAIIALRTPECKRTILPYSLSYPPQDNSTYASSLKAIIPAFQNFSLTDYEILEDIEQKKIVMHLRARADTAAGEYLNEYMWILKFNGEGKIEDQKEYVDVGVNRDFFPKLQKALKGLKEGSSPPATNGTS